MEDQEKEGPVTSTVAEVRGVASDSSLELSEAAIASSEPFVGRWSRLISTTNWEKGRIISEWRDALQTDGAGVTDYSDEAWSQLVGGVTSQHVGRLRRVHQRFGSSRDQYEGLYWSHFQVALDWDDAELWLEGAVKKGWSVAKMRAGRWEAVGAPDGAKPGDADVVDTAIDEDAYDALMRRDDGGAPEAAPEIADAEGAAPAPGEPSGVESTGAREAASRPAEDDAPEPTAAPRVRPFAEIGELPDDVSDAFEQFKLAILSHKLTEWQAISADEMLGCLEALKALVVAPSAND